jgi:hypothetical protein
MSRGEVANPSPAANKLKPPHIMVLSWDFYEIRSSGALLHGVKLRGRIRKFTIENDISCLMENAVDEENVVRFALLTNSDPK